MSVEHLEAAREASRKIEAHRDAMHAWAAERARLIRAAMAAGMTQTEVAAALGVRPQTIVNRLKQHPETEES